jgi:hypothetical protein
VSAPRPAHLLAAAPLVGLLLAACGSSVSTSSFKGEAHEVAQTIANLQTDATAGDQAKICSNDLAAATVARLGGKKACEAAIKNQVSEIDNLEASVESVHVDPAGKTATATVKSVYGGKKRTTTVTLVKEGGRWRVSALA